MKTLSILTYAIGFILLLVSCFVTGVTVTWWLGGLAVFFLIIGCVFQFNSLRHENDYSHR